MRILFIGCGAVGSGLLELWNISNNPIGNLDIVMIEPKELPEWVIKTFPQIVHIKIALNEKLVDTLLKKLLDDKTFVIDVSVNVDCIEIMKLCSKYKSMYINTSLEDWCDEHLDITSRDLVKLEEWTLYYQALIIRRALKHCKTSIAYECGANPGVISYLALKGLHDCAEQYGSPETKKLIEQKKYNQAAKKLGLATIHVSEFDTQLPYKKRPKGEFWNTWSCIGLQAEGIDPVQVGWGSFEDQAVGFTPRQGEKNIRFFQKRGVDAVHNTVGLDYEGNPKYFKGYMIPHGEANSLSRTLTYKGYRPSVFYVYDPPECAKESIKMFKKNDYNIITKTHVLRGNDIKSGFDSIGALLMFNGTGEVPDKTLWWTGTVLDIKDVRKMGFKYTGPTVIQVVANINACVEYMMEHPKNGLMSPEDFDWKLMMKKISKYLGKIHSKEIK